MYDWGETCFGFDWCNVPNLDSPEIFAYNQGAAGDWGDAVEGSLHFTIYQAMAMMKRGTWILQAGDCAEFRRDFVVDHESMRAMVGIFAVLPMVIATMRDVQLALDERETGVQALQFVMGCPESAYFAAVFVGLTASAVLPYVVLSVVFAFLLAMAGTSVGVLLLAGALFIISHVVFLVFIMTFLRKARGGRAVTVIVLVMSVFFAYLHDSVTLNGPNWLKDVLASVPIGCYQLITMSLYEVVQGKLPPVVWSGIWRQDGGYPAARGLVWLAADAVMYFVLFLAFHVAGVRPFGAPLLRWRDVLNPCAWRRLMAPRPEQRIRRLRVNDLSMVYSGLRPTRALQEVSFNADVGDCVVVIGSNGAGKSTLLNSLMGMIVPTTGSLILDDEPPTTRFDSLWRGLGVCFQRNTLLPELNAEEHFSLFGTFRGMDPAAIDESVDYIASALDMGQALQTRAKVLSGGQKRKLCLALALLGDPGVVIADEPTAGVDVRSSRLVWQTLSNLPDTVTIVTSHSLEEAATGSSRLLLMAGGRLIFDGTAAELRRDRGGRYTLRVDCDDFAGCFDRVRALEPEARCVPGLEDTLSFPISRVVPRVLRALEAAREELGLRSYSLVAQPLEVVLVDLVQSEAGLTPG